jgi:hypothetical protein
MTSAVQRHVTTTTDSVIDLHEQSSNESVLLEKEKMTQSSEERDRGESESVSTVENVNDKPKTENENIVTPVSVQNVDTKVTEDRVKIDELFRRQDQLWKKINGNVKAVFSLFCQPSLLSSSTLTYLPFPHLFFRYDFLI